MQSLRRSQNQPTLEHKYASLQTKAQEVQQPRQKRIWNPGIPVCNRVKRNPLKNISSPKPAPIQDRAINVRYIPKFPLISPKRASSLSDVSDRKVRPMASSPFVRLIMITRTAIRIRIAWGMTRSLAFRPGSERKPMDDQFWSCQCIYSVRRMTVVISDTCHKWYLPWIGA